MKTFVISNTMFFDDDTSIQDKINLWNSVVSKNDKVYILGNFCLDPVTFSKLFSTLNGKKEILTGEFDSYLLNLSQIKSSDYCINTNQIITLHNFKCVLSFWPLRLWENKYKTETNKETYCNIYGFDSGLVEPENLSGSCAVNSKFGNKPINLDLFVEILNKKI